MTPAESLTSRTARATQWRLASVFVSTLARLAIGILLARLLTPADFGIVTLAYVVLGFVGPLNDLGIGAALVQRVELTERHLRVAFTSSLGLGLAVALGMVAAAPAAARLLGDTAVTPVLRTLSLAFVISSTATVADAMLQRRLDFKRQSFVDTGSHLLGYGGVAITLALLGYGVWSLVWGALVQALGAATAQLAIVRHPMRPLLARRELRDLLHFGFGSTVNALVSYVALNGDNFVVGRWIGAAGLGLYSRAYGLMNLPHTLFASVVTRVLFPAFSRAQGDPARLRRAYLLVTGLTAMIAAPAMGTLAVAAPHLVLGLYGPQWSGVVIPAADSVRRRILPGRLPPGRRGPSQCRVDLPMAPASCRVRRSGARSGVGRIAVRPRGSRHRSGGSDPVHVRRDRVARAARDRHDLGRLRRGTARRHRDCRRDVRRCVPYPSRVRGP